MLYFVTTLPDLNGKGESGKCCITLPQSAGIFLMEFADCLYGILNRFEIRIKHRSWVDIFLV